jgi:signal peptidase
MSEEIKYKEVKVEEEKEEVVKEKSMVKKVFGWIGTGFLTLLVVMASWLCFDKFVLKHRVPSIFGYSSLIVATGSMNGSEVNEGDLIIIKDTGDYEIGEIVTFFQDGDDIPTTHRIINYKDIDGVRYWKTRGDANNSPDERLITSDEIIGEVVLVIPYVGTFIDWAVEGGGLIYIVGIFLILGLGIYIIKGDDDEDEEESSEPTPSE